ncbi:hypothetical protein MgSA37_03239 [Mucilaginibacter gotjawali]|uniref:Uncharacterized protein n=1 Tax=Mucilaginibacter gotjawali TaxID=1550579 RepID=A0A110B368_9SPHI|nr:hypothetical protein [Mucilaginibacter gotjawali]BAU55058.1 hypothetical protein MgSA37_03239 [Mucilaginibacter gotjawali]
MKQINIKQINDLHNDALRGLEFYKQELTILQERLEEIAADNTDVEVLEKVDHFQNQFIIHQRYIDDLMHDIRKNLKHIEEEVVTTSGFLVKVTLLKMSICMSSLLPRKKSSMN